METQGTQIATLSHPSLRAGNPQRPRGDYRTVTRGEPLVLDGRSSHMSYLVSACLDEADTWNALAVRMMGQDQDLKIKFFPTRDFMIPLDKLMALGANRFLDRFTHKDRPFPYAGYHRFFIPARGYIRLLEHLWTVPDMVVAPVDMVFDWLKYVKPEGIQSFRFDPVGKIMPMPGQALPEWAQEVVPVVIPKARKKVRVKVRVKAKVRATKPASASEKKGRVFQKLGETLKAGVAKVKKSFS